MDSLAALDADLLATYRARTPESRALSERAARVLPGGDTRTGTFFLPYPIFVTEGRGSRLTDADGNQYLDFLNNFTSLIHGHSHPEVNAAITDQLGRSTVHGTATDLQIRLAEILCGRVASLERVRFCNSGTEATMAALRAAKAFTGRPKIMKMEGGYHGSHDYASVGMVPPFDLPGAGLSPGVLGEVILGGMNDIERTVGLIRTHGKELAAVIVEPLMGSAGAIRAEPEFLSELRRVTEEQGVLLILDEIITFRLDPGGLQSVDRLRPDLTTLGKIVGGGLPVGAFGGRADVMAVYDPSQPGSITHSGTYNGNALTMAAGIATLERFPAAEVARLNGLGDRLRADLQARADRIGAGVQVRGYGSLMQVHFAPPPIRSARDAAKGDRRRLRLLHLALLNRGLFVPSRQMYVLSTVMTEAEIATFADGFEAAIQMIADAGAPVGNPA